MSRLSSFLEEDRLLTIDDLALMLGVTRKAAYNLRHRGALPPAIKWGNSIRFRPDDVQAWLDARREDGGA